MHNVVKQVMLIAGFMMVSLALFMVMFGDIGRQFMWTNMEPLFQDNWELATFDDGKTLDDTLTSTFDSTVEVTQFQ